MVSPAIPDKHFIGELGIEHWVDDDTSYGRIEITSDMLVPGTGFARIGLLATVADVVSGQPPTGVMTPTTDLSVHVGRQIEMKTVHLESKVIKAGATLAVVRSLLRADDQVEPFATSLATFMNRRIDVVMPVNRATDRLNEPLSSRIGARVLTPGNVELDARGDIANTFHGTVQGGVIALLGEMAIQSAMGMDKPYVVTDLDVRYLNRAKIGPVAAVAEVIIDDPVKRVFGVEIRDQGDRQRMVAYASASGPGGARSN